MSVIGFVESFVCSVSVISLLNIDGINTRDDHTTLKRRITSKTTRETPQHK